MDLFGDTLPQDALTDVQSNAAFPPLYGHQEKLDALLHGLNNGQGPASLIISGKTGIGKATFARHLVCKLLHKPYAPIVKVEDSEDGWGNLTHPDLLIVQRGFDDRKNERRTEILQDDVKPVAPFLRRTAAHDGFRIVIIDDASSISERAQNVLLKILEEPPPQALLVLITHSLGHLIRTIKSRCQVLALSPLEPNDMLTCLAASDVVLPNEWRDIILDFAAGSPGLATELALQATDQDLNLAFQLLETPDDVLAKYKMTETLATAKNIKIIVAMTCHILQRLAESRAANSQILTPYLVRFGNATKQKFEQTVPLAFLEKCAQLQAHMRYCDVGNLDKKSTATGIINIICRA